MSQCRQNAGSQHMKTYSSYEIKSINLVFPTVAITDWQDF